MKKLRVVSLCDGISGGQIALEKMNIPIEVYYASEIKKEAIEVTQYNYSNTIQLGDLTKYDFNNIKDIDLFLCGSPCQDLSQAHKDRLGLNGDKSSLFYKCVEIMHQIKPKYFLFENVKMTNENYEIFSEILGTYPININSSLVSAQLRNRYYWTNIGPATYDLFNRRYCNIPLPNDKNIKLQDILTSGFTDRDKSRALLESDSRPLVNKKNILHRYYNTGFTTVVFEDLNDKEHTCRYLNQVELERCQTLPDGYTKILNRNKAAGCIGDSWTVDVIAHIFSYLKADLQEQIG